MVHSTSEIPQLHWDSLHAQRRFRPQYPSEHLVRFLLSHTDESGRNEKSALDIGIGGGRHVKLLCDLGFRTSGVDISPKGLRECEKWLATAAQIAHLQLGSMVSLPFEDGVFDIVLSYSVFYYGNKSDMERAVAEMHRVLRQGGQGFVVLRTTDDYRYGKGSSPEPDTFQMDTDETNERGLLQHFVSEDGILRMFASFNHLCFEKSETTFNERRATNSDWLITVTR